MFLQFQRFHSITCNFGLLYLSHQGTKLIYHWANTKNIFFSINTEILESSDSIRILFHSKSALRVWQQRNVCFPCERTSCALYAGIQTLALWNETQTGLHCTDKKKVYSLLYEVSRPFVRRPTSEGATIQFRELLRSIYHVPRDLLHWRHIMPLTRKKKL